MITNSLYKTLIAGIFLGVFFSCSKDENNAGPSSLKKIKYTQSNEVFSNPERGFMHIYSVASEGEPLNAVQLRALKQENVTLAHRIYYLEEFKDKPLSAAQLDLIREDMKRIRDAGVKAIIRFAYTGIDYVYETDKGDDAPLEVVEQHLDQLKPVFEENKDVIAFLNAGFIGPWGEWHNSTNNLDTPENMKKVLEKLLSVLPPEIMVQVRTPRYKQEIFGTATPVDNSIAYSDDYRARVGHHNDCFMTGGTDYGTYTNIEAEKEFISNEGLFVPNGGETCPPQGDAPDCTEAKETMRRLRWTYLNLDWYKPTIDAWKSSGCFPEFQRDLGYRLSLVSARLPQEINQDGDITFSIKITNKGYAPLYNNKTSSLVLRGEGSDELHEFELPVDIRDLKPNGTLTIDDTVQITGIPEGIYNLYLKISDQAENLKDRSEYSVRLANPDVWIDDVGMNSLKHKLNIRNN